MSINGAKKPEVIIEVPGVSAELQHTAEEDLGKLITCIKALACKVKLPFMLSRVRVTDDFEGDVNKLLHERRGFTGYVAKRKEVQAIAKTLWIRSSQGEISFLVIIDATQMDPWQLNSPRCLTTILHEMVHVLYEAGHIERLGEDEYLADTDTKECIFGRWATSILDEFNVDRAVDSIVSKLAAKDDGQPYSLLELTEAQGIDWTSSLLDALDKMPSFIDSNVDKFRNRQLGIDELAIEVCPYIKDIFIMLSHTASIYMEIDKWPGIVERIKNTVAFQRFFREHLDTIFEELTSPQGNVGDSIHSIALALEEITSYCGLSFTDVPEGMHIAVRPSEF